MCTVHAIVSYDTTPEVTEALQRLAGAAPEYVDACDRRDRARDNLELLILAAAQSGAGLRRLARASGLHRTQVQRLLARNRLPTT